MKQVNYMIIATFLFVWGLLNFTQGIITTNPFLPPELNEDVVGITRILIGINILIMAAYYLYCYQGDSLER
jgi:hypothetical protein